MLINARIQITQGSYTSDVYSHDAVLVVLVLERKGAADHANASNNAFALCKSAVLKPSLHQWYLVPGGHGFLAPRHTSAETLGGYGRQWYSTSGADSGGGLMPNVTAWNPWRSYSVRAATFA